MSYNKLQGQRALAVVPNNNLDIIHPSNEPISQSGTNSSGNVYDYTNLTAAAYDQVITGSTRFIVSGVEYKNVGIDWSAGYLQVTFGSNLGLVAVTDFYETLDLNEGAVLYVGTGGNVAIETIGGDSVTLTGVISGSFLPVMVSKVKSTGTTASDIIALW
jgi:hypothetical protein